MSSPDEPRSRTHQLIALADRVAQQEVPEEKATGHRWLPIVLGLAGLAILVAGITLATGDSGTSTDPNAPVAWGEYRDGRVYLQGRVPDQATSDVIRDQAVQAVGSENVVVEFVLDQSAPVPDGAPLYIRDVTYATGEAVITSPTKDVLDLGVLLMSQNQRATIEIHSYTDSAATDESALAYSQSRIDAMVAYLVSNGVDPTRLTPTAFGQANPVAANDTEAGRAKNRRTDFTINDLFG